MCSLTVECVPTPPELHLYVTSLSLSLSLSLSRARAHTHTHTHYSNLRLKSPGKNLMNRRGELLIQFLKSQGPRICDIKYMASYNFSEVRNLGLVVHITCLHALWICLYGFIEILRSPGPRTCNIDYILMWPCRYMYTGFFKSPGPSTCKDTTY